MCVQTTSTTDRGRDDRASAPSTLRPRLWYPGLAFVTQQGDLRLGPSVGYSSEDGSFRRLRCGHRSRLEYWTHTAWMVSRSALNAAVIREHAIILPETLIDREALPHAHRWLREQPLVCVSGATWQRLSAAGVCVFVVAFDVSGNGLLDIKSTGGPSGPCSFTVAFDALQDAVLVACNGRASLDAHGDPSLIDRVLRLVSDGVLDESAVLNAFDARSVIEDGYGYRGALEGRFNDIGGLAQEFSSLDALFGQIFERATTMRSQAERLRIALGRAMPGAHTVSVPLYGAARRVNVPPLCVPRAARWNAHGQTERDLELPAERRWTVGDSDSWSPQLPTHLA